MKTCRLLVPVLPLLAVSLHAGLVPDPGIIDHTLCCGTGPMANARHEAQADNRRGGAKALFASVAAPASTAGASVEANASASKTPPQVENGYLKLGFDRLSAYKFVPPPYDPLADPKAKPPTGEEQIPAEVKAWNGKKAIVTGFMQPVRMENGLVTEFLLMKDASMCCYGVIPNMNEWIIVKMPKGVRPLMDLPISFYGELKVGAMFESGYMTGIYLLEGEKMGEVQG